MTGDPSTKAFTDTGMRVSRVTWIVSILAVFGGLACIAAISVSGWSMSYSTAASSLESAGEDFMANIPLYIESSLKHRLDPIRFHLRAGLSMLHSKGANVSTWEGISHIRPYSTPFLQNFFGDTKCCFGVAINMGFDKAEVDGAGGWQQWLDAHPNDWGDDRMVSDVVLLDQNAAGETTFTGVQTSSTNGSSTNTWLARPLDPVSYEPLVPHDEGADLGFARMPWLDITWKTVHWNNLQPGEFRFTPIITWDITKPNCLKTHGVVPLYENTRTTSEHELAEFKAGRPPWSPGRRVGAWIIGFKMWFLSDHFAGMNLKGGFVYLVEKASGIFVASSDTSLDTLGEDDRGERIVTKQPSKVAHPLVRGSATMLAPDGSWNRIPNQMSHAIVGGAEQFLLTFSFSYYGLDLLGVYMVPRSIVFAQLDERATQDAAVSFVINTVASGFLVCGILCSGYQSFKRLRTSVKEQERAIHMKVQKGVECASELSFPMCIIMAEDFLALQVDAIRTCHEGIREMGLLNVLDTIAQIDMFKKAGYHIVLFSYEWLSWNRRGPTDLQLADMRKSLEHFSALKAVPLSNIAVWLDILSIPQCHPGMKAIAVDSLGIYAASSSALVIIAPESQHEDTQMTADLCSYRARVWTRLEQVMMFATNGLDSVFVAEEDNIKPITMDVLQDSLNIFDASMTCCRRKHEHQNYCDKETLVLPMLGLWFRLLAAQRGIAKSPGAEHLYRIYQANTERYFPRTFMYSQMDTKRPSVDRPLFGDMLEQVSKIAGSMTDEQLQDMLASARVKNSPVIVHVSTRLSSN